MRKILFRGRRKDNANIIYGNLTYKKNGLFINGKEVYIDSIGRCSNKRDSNGELIFEKDLVKAKYKGYEFVGGVYYFNNCFYILDFKTDKLYKLSFKYDYLIAGRNKYNSPERR